MHNATTDIARNARNIAKVFSPQRIDWIKVENAPALPMPKLPKGFKACELWGDYRFCTLR